MIYQRTHSAYWLSVLFLLTFGVNGLLSPLFGALADRHDRRVGSGAVGIACIVLVIGLHGAIPSDRSEEAAAAMIEQGDVP